MAIGMVDTGNRETDKRERERERGPLQATQKDIQEIEH